MQGAVRDARDWHPRRAVVVGYQPLVVVLAAFCAGIIVDRHAPAWGVRIPAAASWAAGVGCLCGWLPLRRARCDRLGAWLLLLSVAAAGGSWHHARWRLFSAYDLGHYARAAVQPVCVIGIAGHAPQRIPAAPPDPLQTIDFGDRSRMELRLAAIRDGGAWRPARGRATLLVVGHLTGVAAGDRVRVFATLSRTVPARNPGEFDFAEHARGNRQMSVLRSESPDCVTVLSAGTPWRVRRLVDRVRAWGSSLLWGQLGNRQSALADAVLLGAREQVGAERTQSFITTGTVHLLVVSGLHLGILAGGLFFALRLGLLPRRTALVLVAVLVVAYMMVTEARPSVVRACILVVVVCLARFSGRRAVAFNSLAAAALVVLALNPADLFRTGPQLSFLAVAALAWLAAWQTSAPTPDALDQLLAAARPWLVRAARWSGWAVWQLTLASAVVWFVVEPLVMARFHLLTPIAVLLGPILWLPVAAGLMSGFGVLLCGWLLPPLGLVLAWICDRSLALVEHCVTAASALPGSHFWVTGPADWWLVGFYGGLALISVFPRLRPPRRWCLALFAGWVALGFGVARSGPARQDALQCTFLSMGHGCAVVMELPTGQTLLYDCGSLGPAHSGARTIACYLWSRGITRLDAVVLSHADADHWNALPELLSRFPVRMAIVAPRMFAGDAPSVTVLRSALEAAAVPVREVWAGDRLVIGRGIGIAVLHPPRAGVPGSDNANSVVLAVDYAGRRFLLPGDLEAPGLEKVLAQPALDCSVLLAPHHGSHRSNPAGFAAWCGPEWAVISGRLPGEVGRVRQSYGDLGVEVLHTAERGAIRFTVSGRSLQVDAFLPPDRAAPGTAKWSDGLDLDWEKSG